MMCGLYYKPIVRQNGGWAWFIGNQRATKVIFIIQFRTVCDSEWRSWLLRASTSGIISQSNLLNSKSTMPEALYNQEFECTFRGRGKVFRGVREVADAEPKNQHQGIYM